MILRATWFRYIRNTAAGLLLVTGALLLIVSCTPLVPFLAAKLADDWTDSDGDVLIVLGGETVEHSASPEESFIGLSSYWRSVYAAQAWRKGHFRMAVISGAGTAPEMRRFLTVYGVPEQAILLEDRSHTTRENALFTQELLLHVPGKKVLLTSDFHMYRAAAAFRRAGLNVVSRPFPDVLKRGEGWPERWACFWLEMEELGKIVYYRSRGWI